MSTTITGKSADIIKFPAAPHKPLYERNSLPVLACNYFAPMLKTRPATTSILPRAHSQPKTSGKRLSQKGKIHAPHLEQKSKGQRDRNIPKSDPGRSLGTNNHTFASWPALQSAYPSDVPITQDTTVMEDDEYIFCPPTTSDDSLTHSNFTAYKRVDKKIRPVSTFLPPEMKTSRPQPPDPMLTFKPLPFHPPTFVPTPKITTERLKEFNINTTGFLWPEEEKLFQHIMVMNQNAIAFEDAERGTLKESYFSPYIIPTVPHVPWEYRNIPIPPGIMSKVLEVLKLKIQAGVYEPSQSSYRSRWFVVLKKNGKLRIVHDLQPLNRVTIKDTGMVPIIDSFVEQFAGRQCYSVFDLFWGFDARKIHPDSRPMTAFMTPLGLLQITSLPTGYTNSPSEFQGCMTSILRDEIPDKANIFIDDLPIKGPATQYLDLDGDPETLTENPGIRRFIWEHAVDVHRILHKIGESGATIAAAKSQVCLPEVLIVGQKCTAQGREVDDSKVEKILTWPAPRNVKEVRQFLGLCGTVRIWIPNYSQTIRPLTELYRKETTEFVWDRRRQRAFEEIRRLVASTTALRPLDYNSENPVILSVDSSYIAVGMIVSQEVIEIRRKIRYPSRYGSEPMSKTAARYSQPKLELYGLFIALSKWKLYLVGVRKLIVEVDAKYIKGMLNDPDLQPNAAVNRWIQGILMFDFTLVHVPADKHKGPDALSRRPLAPGETATEYDDSWLDDIVLMTLIPERDFPPFPTFNPLNNFSGMKQPRIRVFASRISQDILLHKIRHFLTTLEAPDFPNPQAKRRFLAKALEFFVKDSRLHKRNGDRPPLLVVFEPREKQSILLHAHENLGHRGVQAVFEVLRRRFFWPHLRADVQHHVKSCHECQIRNTHRLEKPLVISTPAILFEKVYIDIMHMPKAHGYKYIVAVKDDLSGTSEAKALKKATAKQLKDFFWDYIFCQYGAPLRVVTDNGPETKEAFAMIVKRLGIPHIRITPYNHHANGVVERGHFIIREALVKVCGDNINDWPNRLAEIIFADRVTVSKVTGYSPFQLLHGTDPLLPLDLAEATFLVEEFKSGISTEDLLALRARQITKHPEDVERAAETLRKARFTSKEQFEKRFERKLLRDHYRPGELVLVRNTAVEMSHDRKHLPRYLGPYEVVRQTSGGNYKLKELDGSTLQTMYAAFRVIPYITRRHKFMRENMEQTTDESDPDDSD